MNFYFPDIHGLQEYYAKAQTLQEIHSYLQKHFGELESTPQLQHQLFRYLNEQKHDYPWLSWRIRMSQGKISVVLFFEGLPNTRKPIEDIKVKEGVL